MSLAPVRDADQLDWATIDAYVRAHAPAVAAAPLRDVQQFTNGAANLTYLLRFGDRALVLRRPPGGTIAPGAHDMRREWRVLSRLWRHFEDRKSTRLNSSHGYISYAVFCLKKKKTALMVNCS